MPFKYSTCNAGPKIRHSFCIKHCERKAFIIQLDFGKLLFPKNLTYQTMSQCRKDKAFSLLPKYLFLLFLGICLSCFSSHVMAQDDPHTPPSHERPQGPPPPPPHPKPPSLKKMFGKLFKKNDGSSDDSDSKKSVTQTSPGQNAAQNATAQNAANTSANNSVNPNTGPATNSKKTDHAVSRAEPQPTTTGIKPTTTTSSGTTNSISPLAKPTASTAKKKTAKKTPKPSTDSKAKATQPII
ncbi:MAG: hypothetical protein JSU01_13270 [Bacteroidetes bacterium]|nr:hypothetical protein [Bacteroidota bacterium]